MTAPNKTRHFLLEVPTTRSRLQQLAAELDPHEEADITLMRTAGTLTFPSYPLRIIFGRNWHLEVQRDATIAPTILKPTPSEFRVLGYLASNADTVLSKPEILEAMRNDALGDQHAVDAHLHNLKTKFVDVLGIEDISFPVRNVRSVGFVFDSIPAFSTVTGERIAPKVVA